MTDTETTFPERDIPAMDSAALEQIAANTQIINDVIMMTSLSFIDISLHFSFITIRCTKYERNKIKRKLKPPSFI